MKLNLIKVVSYIYIFCVMWGVFVVNASQDLLYIMTVLFVLVQCLLLIGSNAKFKIYSGKTEYICLIILTAWLYGIIVGILRGNNVKFVFRNFAGLSLFFLIYIIKNMRLSLKNILNLVLFISTLEAVLLPIAYICLRMGIYGIYQKIPIISCLELNLDETGYIGILFNSCSMIFVGYIFCLYKCLYLGKIFSKYMVVVIYDALVIMICSRMGGMELALLGLTALMVFAFAGRRMNKWGFTICLIGMLTAVMGMIILNINPIAIIFGRADSGNNERYRQINYVLSHFSAWGHGLGAEYTELGKGYAIEVIYVDLVYKLGLMSIPILGTYAYIMLNAIKILKKTEGNAYDSIPLGLTGCLFFSFGNPFLFSGVSVLSCIIAMLTIENIRKRSAII